MLNYWKNRLITEQAQIDGTRRTLGQYCRMLEKEVNPSTRKFHESKIMEFTKNLSIMIQMHEALRDQLGIAGILEQIEKR